jgi:phenylacetate-CoA ligase
VRGYFKKLLMAAPKPVFDWGKALHSWIPDSMRYGKEYRDALDLFKESDWWDEQTLVRYQEHLLRGLVAHCYANTTYYNRLFRDAGLKPDDVRTLQDLGKLPYLTKEIVRAHKDELRATNVSSFRTELEQTGGSTGGPLMFLMDWATRAMERALMLRQLMWLGWEKGDVVAEIKSDSFANPRRIYQYSPTSKVLRFGSFRVDSDRLAAIVQALQEFRPAFIKIYPSSLYVLSRWMERHGKSVDSVRYIVTSSETLFPSIKEQAERAFCAPVIDNYGQDEQVASAFQCSVGQGYHMQVEHNLVELIPARDGQWEIVGTSLRNFAMPFVRYRTGDLAVRSDSACPCGRKHPLIAEIRGRHGDIVITPEGNIMSLVAMTDAFDDVETIKEAQVVQEEIDLLRIRVVPWDHVPEDDKERLLTNLKRHLNSPRMTVLWEVVERIPRTMRGKKPFVVSHIKIDDYL